MSVQYHGDVTFQDMFLPVPYKTEWGMDGLLRVQKGAQSLLTAFVAGLSQGATYTFNSGTYYLQSFEPNDDPVFPEVTMHYKGLHGGIPPPKSSGATIEQNITVAASASDDDTDAGSALGTINGVDVQTAERQIRYFTRRAETLYITTSRPTSASYGIDADVDIYVDSSVIRATDINGKNYVFSGTNAPAAIVTALTPATTVQSFMQCNPVVGSPYFECRDVATKLYMG